MRRRYLQTQSDEAKQEDLRISRFIALRVRSERLQRGQTQPELAAILHCEKSLISCYEGGRARFPLRVLYRLARLWSLSVLDFLPLTQQEVESGVPDRAAMLVRKVAADLRLMEVEMEN